MATAQPVALHTTSQVDGVCQRVRSRFLPHNQQPKSTGMLIAAVLLCYDQLFVSRDSPCIAYQKASDAAPWATGEQEFRGLSPEELKACQDGCKPGACKVADLDRPLLQQLYKKGLIHLDVPIRPNDHVSIPPLEVSCLCSTDLSFVCLLCMLLCLCCFSCSLKLCNLCTMASSLLRRAIASDWLSFKRDAHAGDCSQLRQQISCLHRIQSSQALQHICGLSSLKLMTTK